MLQKNTVIIILSALIIIISIGILVVKDDYIYTEQKHSKKEDKQSLVKEQTKESFEEEILNLNNNRDKENNFKREDSQKGNLEKKSNKSSLNKEIIKQDKSIIIDNRCQSTAQALEKIYQDNNYEYYLNSISSGCIYVIVNGSEYTLKQVISAEIVTVYELEENGFKFNKKAINLVSR